MLKGFNTHLAIIILALLSACGSPTEGAKKEGNKAEEMAVLFTEFRQSMEEFKFEEADKLYGGINELLQDKAFNDDRKVLEGYLNSLYSLREEGIKPYRQFIRGLPKSYDGILSETLWEDYAQLSN